MKFPFEPLVVREGDPGMPSVMWIAFAATAMEVGCMVAQDGRWVRLPHPPEVTSVILALAKRMEESKQKLGVIRAIAPAANHEPAQTELHATAPEAEEDVDISFHECNGMIHLEFTGGVSHAHLLPEGRVRASQRHPRLPGRHGVR